MDDIIKVGLLGAGVISTRLAQSFDKHPQFRINAVVDLDLKKASVLASKYSVKATTDIEEILDLVDVIYVGVTPKSHSTLTIQALNAGKHVICEKPIALTSKEVAEMIMARDNNSRITAINLPFRFDDGIQKLKSIVEAETYGKARQVSLTFRFPYWPRLWQQVDWLKYAEQGGPLREVGTHYLFALNEIFGDFDKIHSIIEYPDDTLCENSCIAIIKMKSGISCNLSLLTGTSEKEENTLSIFTDNAVIRHKRWSELSVEKEEVEIIQTRSDNAEYNLIDNFAKAINGDSEAKSRLVSFEQAGQAQQMLELLLNK